MAASAEPSSGFKYEAFVSHTSTDRRWAKRLLAGLNALGVGDVEATYTMPKPGVGEVAMDALKATLGDSRTLIVLWTPAAVESVAVSEEVASFEAIAFPRRLKAASGKPTRLILPIVFGEPLLGLAPSALRSRQPIVLDPAVYSAGPDKPMPEWNAAVESIARALAASLPDELRERREADLKATHPLPRSVRPALEQTRVWVMHDGRTESGWMLTDRLAVARPESPLPEQVTLRTEVGIVGARVGSWSTAPGPLDSLTPLHLDTSQQLPRRLPLGPSIPGSPIEIWNWPLTEANGRGQVGELGELGRYELALHDEGVIEPGAAVVSPQGGHFLGVVGYGGSTWHLVPAAAMIKSLSPAPPAEPAPPPSARIHDDSWTLEDQLDYKLYARAIAEFVQHPNTRPPLVIGVQGPWGQGKTSLMRLTQDRLDPQHADLLAVQEQQAASEEVDGPTEATFRDLRDSLDGDVELAAEDAAGIRSVWFNPWKYQSSEALWAGLAHSILTQLPARLPRAERELFWLRLQLRRIDPAAVRRDIQRLVLERLLPWLIGSVLFAVAVALALLLLGAETAIGFLGAIFSGTAISAVAWIASRKSVFERKLEGSYRRYVSEPDYAGKLGYLHHVEEDMRHALALLAPADEPTVIFIDDLDRCSAAKIGEVLEAINLFLSGEYPNCIFVLGIDAQVVASAMETIHRQALGEDEGRSDDLKGNLGWRFLDKFIQLSFVMPRPSERQRGDYLDSLLGIDSAVTAEDYDAAAETMAEVDSVRDELLAGRLAVDDAARRVGELAAEPGTATQRVQEVAEHVIAIGAKEFSDADQGTVKALRSRLLHLSDNPRTIKRAVNLYRFYRVIAWAREASSPDLSAAGPELIAAWTVLAARWPQAVHWLQVNGHQRENPEGLLRSALEDEEPELCRYLDEEKALDLKRAMDCGLW